MRCPNCLTNLEKEISDAIQHHSEPEWVDDIDCPGCGVSVAIEGEVTTAITIGEWHPN